MEIKGREAEDEEASLQKAHSATTKITDQIDQTNGPQSCGETRCKSVVKLRRVEGTRDQGGCPAPIPLSLLAAETQTIVLEDGEARIESREKKML